MEKRIFLMLRVGGIGKSFEIVSVRVPGFLKQQKNPLKGCPDLPGGDRTRFGKWAGSGRQGAGSTIVF